IFGHPPTPDVEARRGAKPTRMPKSPRPHAAPLTVGRGRAKVRQNARSPRDFRQAGQPPAGPILGRQIRLANALRTFFVAGPPPSPHSSVRSSRSIATKTNRFPTLQTLFRVLTVMSMSTARPPSSDATSERIVDYAKP